MKQIGQIDGYHVFILSKEFLKDNIGAIRDLANQIPFVEYSNDEMIADKKEDRIFWGKEDHSIILMDKEEVIGLVLAYEREKEENDQYPENTLYINIFSVKKDYQKKGLGTKLLDLFIKYNKNAGFLHLEGKINFSVQTNLADWNSYVINLYKKFGFNERAQKKYDNRIDSVLGLS